MPKIIVSPEKKVLVEELNKEVRVSKFEKFYLDENKKFFESTHGKILLKDVKPKFKVQNKDFFSFDSCFIDDYKQIKRSAQIIPLKDIGFIIGETGLNKNSVVVEAGSGSGGFSCFIANIVKKVYSFDIVKDNIFLAENNTKKLGFDNVVFHNLDIYNAKEVSKIVSDADLFLLDVPEPKNAVNTAKKILKLGGFIVVYQPYIPQTIDFVNSLKKESSLLLERIVEVNIRDWEFDDRKVRPGKDKISHSGFLVFVRKIYENS